MCYFKSKYPLNVTLDEEWLQGLEKKFQVLKFFTSPVRAYGRGKGGDAHFYAPAIKWQGGI